VVIVHDLRLVSRQAAFAMYRFHEHVVLENSLPGIAGGRMLAQATWRPGMPNTELLISADSHVMEDHDLWTRCNASGAARAGA